MSFLLLLKLPMLQAKWIQNFILIKITSQLKNLEVITLNEVKLRFVKYTYRKYYWAYFKNGL